MDSINTSIFSNFLHDWKNWNVFRFSEELNGKSETVVIPLCFAFSCFNLFFKEVLSLKKEYPRIDKFLI